MTTHKIEGNFLAATTRTLQDQPLLFSRSGNKRSNPVAFRGSSGLGTVLESRKRIPKIYLSTLGGVTAD
jgi:hypothetical protein